MRRLDYKSQLVEYFKKNINKNYAPDTLKFALTTQGYSRVIVDQAFNQAVKELAEKAPILKEKPIIRHEVYDMHDKPIKLEPFTFWEKLINFLRGRNI